jgi:predicted GIY-YIG superfamily endonuclease
MAFFAYILHCRGGSFYTGHTDDLEQRMGQHISGLMPGFTADHLPVKLVWSQEFPTRYEALAAERQIKGLSRAKKLALIRGDWVAISTLVKKKDDPSTGSGRTGLGGSAVLHLHPSQIEGLNSAYSIKASYRRLTRKMKLQFELTGNMEQIVIPKRDLPLRTDELWQTTCFELFVRRPTSDAYIEYNFSPSFRWAAYGFSTYRNGMFELPSTPPKLKLMVGEQALILQIEVALPDKCANRAIEIGLSAVIEETDGTKSYWALAHPPGKPDFHHKDCFALQLEAPSAA